MPTKINLSDFGIKPENIPQEVKKKYDSLSGASKSHIEKDYGSALDFVAVLYHLWFVEKLERSEIAAKLNVQSENIHIQQYNLSWQYSNDYIKNNKLFEEDIKRTKALLTEAKAQSLLLDVNHINHRKLHDAFKKSERLRKTTYINLGLETVDEYVRVLYYLIYIKQISPIKLIPLFGLNFHTIEQRLRVLGLNSTHKEGIAGKKRRGSHDYVKSENSKKKTVARKQANTYSASSDPENYVRIQISNSIYDYLDDKQYEVVVGVAKTGILSSLEIDIPIIVYDLNAKYLFKFAVEYNDDFRHSDARDTNKKIQAENKGWIYLDVLHKGRISNNLRLLDPKIRDLCESIKKIVETDKRG